MLVYIYFGLVMIEFDVKIDGVEYIKLNYTLVYRNPALLIVVLAALATLLVSAITGSLTADSFTSSPVLIIAALVLAYVFFILPVIVFYRVRTLYNTMPLLHEQLRYKVDEKGVSIKGKTVKEKNAWKDYTSIKQTKNWLILWKAQNMGTFIPKTAFKTDDDLQAVIALSKAAGLKIG